MSTTPIDLSGGLIPKSVYYAQHPEARPVQPGATPQPSAAPGEIDLSGGLIPADEYYAQHPEMRPQPTTTARGLLSRAYQGAKDAWKEWSNYDASHSLPQIGEDIGEGALKGIGHTSMGINRLANAATGGILNRVVGIDPSADALTTPANPGQKVGFGLEQGAEYIAPEGLADRGAARLIEGAADLADSGKAGRAVGKLTEWMAKPAARAVGAAGVATLQGNDPAGAAEFAAAEPLLLSGGRAARGVLSNALRRSMVGDVAQGVHETVPLPDIIAHARAEGIPATTANLTDSGMFKLLENTAKGGYWSRNMVMRRGSQIIDALNNSYESFLNRLAPENTLEDLKLDLGPGMSRGEAGPAVQSALKTARARMIGRFLDRIAPDDAVDRVQRALGANLSPLESGRATQSALREAMDRERLGIGGQFGDLDNLAAGAQVTPTATAEKIADLEGRFANRARGVPTLLPSQTMRVLNDLKEWASTGKPVSWSQMQDARSALLKAGHLPGDPIEEEGRAALRELAHALDTDMTGSATGLSPDAMKVFREANQRYRSLSEAFSNPRSTVYQAMMAADPATVNAMLTNGSEHTLGVLRNYLGEGGLSSLRGDFVRRLGTGANGAWDDALFRRNFGGYTDTYLKKLLPAGQVADLQGAYRRSVAADLLERNRSADGIAGIDAKTHDALRQAFANPQSKIVRAINAADPATAIPMLTHAANGGDVGVLDQLKGYLPEADMNALRRDFIERLGDKGGGAWDEAEFQRNLAKYSDDYLSKLFPSDQLEALRGANRRSIARTLLDRNENQYENWKTFPGRWKTLSDQELAQAQFAPHEINWLKRHAALAHAISENITPSGTPLGMSAQADAAAVGWALDALRRGSMREAVTALSIPAGKVAAGRIALSPAIERWATAPVDARGMLSRWTAEMNRPVGKLAKAVAAAAAERGANGRE